MSADKRIPVTEETRKELHALKAPGQTYGELLQELAQQRRRKDPADRFRGMDENRDEFVALRMADYDVLLSPDVHEVLAAAHDATERVVRDHLE